MTRKQEVVEHLLTQDPNSVALSTYLDCFFPDGAPDCAANIFTAFEAGIALGLCAAAIEAGDWPVGRWEY